MKMEIKLCLIITIVILCSCQSTNIAKIVNTKNNINLKGKVIKIIEKRFSEIDNPKSLTNKKVFSLNSKKQINNIKEFRVFRNIETGKSELKEMREIKYSIKGNKIFQVIELYNSSTSSISTSIKENEKKSFTQRQVVTEYLYLNKNTANYTAIDNGYIDHNGKN